jgi:hypothetical protein
MSAFEKELGVQAPVGYFDPLGCAKDGDVAAFRRRRETELKHGRVAMIASIGYIVPEYFKFPGFLSPSKFLPFSDVQGGLAALKQVPGEGWFRSSFLAVASISVCSSPIRQGTQVTLQTEVFSVCHMAVDQ